MYIDDAESSNKRPQVSFVAASLPGLTIHNYTSCMSCSICAKCVDMPKYNAKQILQDGCFVLALPYSAVPVMTLTAICWRSPWLYSLQAANYTPVQLIQCCTMRWSILGLCACRCEVTLVWIHAGTARCGCLGDICFQVYGLL